MSLLHRATPLAVLVPLLAASAANTPAPAAEKVIWDYWYTVTVGQSVPYAAFNEKVTEKGDRIHMQTHLWKKEEGYINEENLGAFARNDDVLEPLIFNYQSVYRNAETRIDGTLGADTHGRKVLSVKVNQGAKDLPPVRETLAERTFLSSFFPVWVGRNLAKMQPKRTYGFRTVLEDNMEAKFRAVSGRAWLSEPDDFARSTGSRKLNVIYRDQQSVWYVDSAGAAVKIVMPKAAIVIERATREKAENFLKPAKK